MSQVLTELVEVRAVLQGATSSDQAPVIGEILIGLGEIEGLIQRSLDVGAWLLTPESLAVVQDRLITYGLTLEREGLLRTAKICLAVALTLAGFAAAPLSLMAAGGGLAMLVADGFNEEEFWGKRSGIARAKAAEPE